MDEPTQPQTPDPNKAGSWNSRGVPIKVYKCHKFDCDFETTELLPKCPECGFNLLDPAAVRLFGVLLAILGAILALGGGALLLFAAPKIQTESSGKYVVIGIFSVLLAVGTVVTIAGIKQAASGNKSGNMIAFAFALFILLGILAALARMVL
jgi:hypothetical protein